jgi:hypothetical protein
VNTDNMINESVEDDLNESGELLIKLSGYVELSLRIVGALPRGVPNARRLRGEVLHDWAGTPPSTWWQMKRG